MYSENLCCLTSHLSEHQGNTGASGLPGLVGFPGAGIQGEKVRLMKMLGIFFPMFFLYCCNYKSIPQCFSVNFQGEQGPVGPSGPRGPPGLGIVGPKVSSTVSEES